MKAAPACDRIPDKKPAVVVGLAFPSIILNACAVVELGRAWTAACAGRAYFCSSVGVVSHAIFGSAPPDGHFDHVTKLSALNFENAVVLIFWYLLHGVFFPKNIFSSTEDFRVVAFS